MRWHHDQVSVVFFSSSQNEARDLSGQKHSRTSRIWKLGAQETLKLVACDVPVLLCDLARSSDIQLKSVVTLQITNVQNRDFRGKNLRSLFYVPRHAEAQRREVHGKQNLANDRGCWFLAKT